MMCNRYYMIIIAGCTLLSVCTATAVTPLLTKQFLVNITEHTCGALDLQKQRRLCKITSEEDEISLSCVDQSVCQARVISCPDGSIDKFCFPVLDTNTMHYQCVCSETLQQSDDLPEASWTTWESNPNHKLHSRAFILAESGQVVFEELESTTEYRYIVSADKLPDNVLKASSELHTGTVAKRARIDTYNDGPCCWVGALTNPPPWLQISLPSVYSIVGVYIKQRCDYQLQYAKVITVTSSHDDITWKDVLVQEDISARYSSYDKQGSVSVHFTNTYTQRFWRIHIIAYHIYPSMKCDLIGY